MSLGLANNRLAIGANIILLQIAAQVKDYDFARILVLLTKYVNSLKAETQDQLPEKLGMVTLWKFKDYRSWLRSFYSSEPVNFLKSQCGANYKSCQCSELKLPMTNSLFYPISLKCRQHSAIQFLPVRAPLRYELVKQVSKTVIMLSL